MSGPIPLKPSLHGPQASTVALLQTWRFEAVAEVRRHDDFESDYQASDCRATHKTKVTLRMGMAVIARAALAVLPTGVAPLTPR